MIQEYLPASWNTPFTTSWCTTYCTKSKDGKWIQKVGSYPKLRLDVALLTDLFQKNDIQVLKSEIINRMIYLICKKAGDRSVEEIIH